MLLNKSCVHLAVLCWVCGRAANSLRHFLLAVLKPSHILWLRCGVEVFLECQSLRIGHWTGLFQHVGWVVSSRSLAVTLVAFSWVSWVSPSQAMEEECMHLPWIIQELKRHINKTNEKVKNLHILNDSPQINLISSGIIRLIRNSYYQKQWGCLSWFA